MKFSSSFSNVLKTQTVFNGLIKMNRQDQQDQHDKQAWTPQTVTSRNRQSESVGHSVANTEASKRGSSSSRVAPTGPKWMSGDSTSIGDGKKMLCVHAPREGRYKWGLRSHHEAHDRSLCSGVFNVGKHGRQVLCFQASELILAEVAEVLMRAVFNKRCNFGSSKQGEESNDCRAEETKC